MHEPLTTQLVAELMRDLLTAFPSRHSSQNIQHTAEVYRNGLRGVTGDALRAAVEIHIKTGEYFPKIARLRELAVEWEKRNRPPMESAKPDARHCKTCGEEFVPMQRWRPKIDDRLRPLMTADGLYLLLEPFTRDLCACAGPCWYEPQAGLPEYACHTDDVQRSYKVWLNARIAKRQPEAPTYAA